MIQDNEKNTPEETPEEVTPEQSAETGASDQPEPTEGGAESAAAATMDPQEIDEGKAFAVLSYVLSLIGLPFFIVPLIMRNNDFALYHAKQCLMIWIVGIVGSAVGGVLSIVCIGFIILLIVGLFCLIINIMGIINSAKGEAVPLPLIGEYAEDWFKGITKV